MIRKNSFAKMSSSRSKLYSSFYITMRRAPLQYYIVSINKNCRQGRWLFRDTVTQDRDGF